MVVVFKILFLFGIALKNILKKKFDLFFKSAHQNNPKL